MALRHAIRCHPAAGLLASISAGPATEESRLAAPAFELVIPGGVLGDLTRYMTATARRPQPLLSLGASLCAIGALMGRKYRTDSNLRSNLYIVGIADSGSGKNHSREVVNELFVEAGLAHYLGGNKIASGAGLLTAIHRQPAILFQIDEFGMFLAAAADRRRSPRHVTDILDNMTELYTAAGGIFLGAEYANRDGQNERRDINQPCLCVYGTTTPLHFWNALQGSNVIDGSLARFIILPTENDYPEENAGAGIRVSPPPLIDSLRFVAAGGGRQVAGNLIGKTAGHETAVDPMTVPMQPGAKEAFRTLGAEITNELREARGTAFTAILARIAENAQKLALVRAVGLDPEAPEITADDADWAIRFGPAFCQPHHGRGGAACGRQRNRAESQADAGNHPRLGRCRADQERTHSPDPVCRQASARRNSHDAGRGSAGDDGHAPDFDETRSGLLRRGAAAMIAKSLNAASNPSSRENRSNALNSMQKTEFFKFLNSSRGVLGEVYGMTFPSTLIEGLRDLKYLILYNEYRYLASHQHPLEGS